MAAPGGVEAGEAEAGDGADTGHAREAALRIAPFGVGLLATFAVAPVEHPREHLVLLIVTFALAVALSAVVLTVRWQRIGSAARLVPVVAVFPIIALLRHAEGGSTSSHAPLVALPLLWLALYATRRQLAAGIALGGVTLALPPLLIGAPEYPPTEWTHLAIYALLAPVAGFVVHDLVDRVRSQTETVETLRSRLALTEESFRAAFNDAPIAQFMCAPTGVVLRVNDALCRLLGEPRDEFIGAEAADLFAPSESARVEAILRALWSGEEAGPAEREIELARRGTDAEKHGLLRIALVRTDSGRPLFLLGHVVDITARVVDAREKEMRAGGARAVKDATDGLGDSPHARRRICEAALDVCAAQGATLMEADEAGRLVTSAAAGRPVAPAAIQIGRRHSHAATALASHESILAGGLDGAAHLPEAGSRVGAVLFEPVLRDGAAVGVLAVAWAQAPPDVPDEALVAAHLVAAEVATVLARADHLESLTRQAQQDPLTALPNRRVWEEQLPRELARATRDGDPLCVAIIDLDHFKAFNDQHGHRAGDRMLLEAASAWRAGLRESDVLARYGGEEFAVILPQCDADQALGLLERLRDATPAPGTCSVGVAAWDRRESADELVERADRALYVAKRAGRDRTCVAPDDVAASTR